MAHEPNFRAARVPTEHRSDPPVPVRSLICLPRVSLSHHLTGLAFHHCHLESRRGRRSRARGIVWGFELASARGFIPPVSGCTCVWRKGTGHSRSYCHVTQPPLDRSVVGVDPGSVRRRSRPWIGPTSEFTNPFLFIVQVRKDYGKSFRSNNTCLLLLPCPRPLVDVLLFIRFSLRFLLLLGGDVESNPGPGDSVLADQLKAIADDIREIKAEKSITNQKLSAIDRKLEKLTGLEKQVSACTKRVVELEKNLAAMTKKIDELENRSRRSNIIVYGIQEEPNETTETLLRTTKERVLEGLLGLDITGIERIHRLGKLVKENPTKSRPVIPKLLDYRDKVSILKECFKLKGSGFSISEDYSHAVRDVRKKLWNRTKENRDRKEKVMLTYDKVRINGRLFAWDEERNDIVEMKTKNATPLTEPRVTRSKK
ncbi:uncharacterized protein LOC119391371 [Rhipicephalus sanguineus]|uniref:uncharacterized protein LOC119391371 n=1 Tax=Rhipicephalus sanguineus TaxID=34632 RepID=UPI0020C3E0A0|nr:uncharacterized protein LOC119391371 [Rhipicephalus sanguineus]